MRFSFAAFVPFFIAGCAGYSFDINENEVYTPAPIYTEFSLADAGLQRCIDQTIKDQRITSAQDLTTLKCSFSGVNSLQGISIFSRIEQLGLKGNNIEKIDELLQLTHLRYLDLTGNPVADCRTLVQLEKLITENLIHDINCKNL